MEENGENGGNAVNRIWLGILVAALAIFGAYLAYPSVINTKLTGAEVYAMLGSYFIITLLIERFTEIVISTFRGKETEEIKAQGDQSRLNQYKAETKKYALSLSFIIAMIISLSGVGFFNEVLVDLSKVQGFQAHLLKGIDIVLTASLISGGSDYFHQFLTMIETFFKKTKEQIENK